MRETCHGSMKQEKFPHELNIHVSEMISASVSWAQTYGQSWNTVLFVDLLLLVHNFLFVDDGFEKCPNLEKKELL